MTLGVKEQTGRGKGVEGVQRVEAHWSIAVRSLKTSRAVQTVACVKRAQDRSRVQSPGPWSIVIHGKTGKSIGMSFSFSDADNGTNLEREIGQ